MIDWQRNLELLLADSERSIRALLAEHESRQDPISAIGYVFEFGRGQLCFDLCANTARCARRFAADHLAKYPNASADELRWNSGDYAYSGAADQYGDGWSKPWWDELKRLDQLSKDTEVARQVHEGIARICCQVLAELGRRGALGDWTVLDFNVAALLDNVTQIKNRDQHIRELIAARPNPTEQ